MTKLFKNSKSVLSVALALAVLAVSLFTGVVINTEAACASSEGVIEVLAYNYDEPEDGDRYFDSNLADNGETGADWEHAIIIDSALELSYLTRKAGNETKGKYYKVADGIKGFDMSGGKITLDGTLDDNLDAITTCGKRHEGDSTISFQGHFDGNGATVYGLWCEGNPAAAGLFPYATGNVTIKNVGVSLSYLKAKINAGGIIGVYLLDPNLANPDTDNALNIESCSVTDCHIETTEGGSFGNSSAGWVIAGTGAIYGGARGYLYNVVTAAPIVVNNCFINLDEAHFVSLAETQAIENGLHGGIGGVAVSNEAKFYNCVVIGITPYSSYNSGVTASTATAHQHTRLAARFTNIYTDAVAGSALSMGGGMANNLQNYDGRITQLTAQQMQGAAAIENMDLDWNVWLANPNGYPELRSAHKDAVLNDNHNGTHSVTCACGVYGAPSDHVYVDGICECGAEFNCANKKTLYWNGATDSKLDDNGESGADADNAIIIDSAEELAYLVRDTSVRDYTANVVTVEDKYYKIADGIGAIVLQPQAYADEIMALNSADQVKAYFEDTSKTFIEWAGCEGWEQGSFAGTFDGNGVTIYGLYGANADGGGNKGLFSTVDAGATFRNFTIKNAYLHTTKDNFNVGAIACVSSDGSYGDIGDGVVWADRCAVVNSYIRNDCDSYTRSGIMFGTLSGNKGEAAYFDNCLVYGNDAAYGANDTPMAILGCARNGITEATNIPEGLETVLSSDNCYRSMVRNSIVIGATPYIAAADYYRVNDKESFVNVYTDAETQNVVRGDSSTVTYEENQIKKLSAIDGATIAAEAENLDWNNVWLAAGVPAFRDAHDDVLSAVPYADDNYAGHTETCSCGLGGLIVKHDYDENYYCPVCEFTCDHRSVAHITTKPIGGDCLTATTALGECDCGFSTTYQVGSAPGHDFGEVVQEDPSDCQTQGTRAYKYCPNCDKKYAADADKMAAFDTALSNEDLKLPLGDHTHAVDDNGVPVYSVTDAGHQKICGVCSEAYGDVETHVGEPVDNGDGTHSITCTVAGCGYAEASAPHNFGDDNVCDTCTYTCTEHDYVDGETIELTFDQRYGENSEAYKDICYYVEQICSVCGTKGENKPIAHTPGEWETNPYADNQPACAEDGYHTEVLSCTECFFEIGTKKVTDPKVGHKFVEYEEEAPTCTTEGTIAYKQCEACWNCFAMDAADDEALENALNPYDGSMSIPVNPDNHVWVEYGKDADCENDGVVAHKFCSECGLFMVNGEETEVAFDYAKFFERDEETYEAIGIGAKLEDNYNKIEAEAFADYIAENYADQGFELVAYPENTEDYEAMDAYYAARWEVENALYELDENWFEAWGKYQMAAWEAAQVDAMYEYLLAEAEAAEIDLVIPAKGHTIVKVDEVPATYDAEGTKAHYACECGKLYSDAEGKNEVTAESLVIAKLVKVEENKPSTDNEAEGDKSDKSPATGESVASVAAVAALMGAAFVLVRKARKA